MCIRDSPGTMQMLDGGISQECRLALRHVSRIISAMDHSTLLRDVVQVTNEIINSISLIGQFFNIEFICRRPYVTSPAASIYAQPAENGRNDRIMPLWTM